MTDPEGSNFDKSIYGEPQLDEEERSSHNLWISSPELKGINIFHARDMLASALAHIRDDVAPATTDVEKDIYDATKLAWTTYEAEQNPPFPIPSIFVPRYTLLKAFELNDVYKPSRRSSVVRLELFSA
jgi:hypothetical protein